MILSTLLNSLKKKKYGINIFSYMTVNLNRYAYDLNRHTRPLGIHWRSFCMKIKTVPLMFDQTSTTQYMCAKP